MLIKINQREPSIQDASMPEDFIMDFEDSSGNRTDSSGMLRVRFQSRSLDDVRLRKELRCQQSANEHASNNARTELNLTEIGCESNAETDQETPCDIDGPNSREQKSQSAPVSPTKVYDRELATFIQCEPKLMADSFVYNIDLSDASETTRHPQVKMAIFHDDDCLAEEILYEPSFNIVHSSLINSCVTITEENEEELEQLRRDDEEELQQKSRNHFFKLNDGSKPTAALHDDDDRADILENETEVETMDLNNNNNGFENIPDDNERLSTIYESLSPQFHSDDDDDPEMYDDAYDKLIVYDVVNPDTMEKPSITDPKTVKATSPSSVSFRSPILDRTRIRSCYADASLERYSSPTVACSASHLCGTTTLVSSKVFTPPAINTDNRSSSSPVLNAHNSSMQKSPTSLQVRQESPAKSSPISLSVPMLHLPMNTDQNTCAIENDLLVPLQNVKMKVIQSSSSSLSDFIMPAPSSTLKSTIHYEEVSSVHQSLTDCSAIHRISCCSGVTDEDYTTRYKSSNEQQRRPSLTRRILTNGLLLSNCSNNNSAYRRAQPPLTFNPYRYHTKPKSEEKLSSLSSPTTLSSSSSSSESSSPSGDKLMSRSDFLPQQQEQQQQQQQRTLSQQRKATSLKTIAETSNQQTTKILYPLDFQTNHADHAWHHRESSPSHHNKVPTCDSGIVIDALGTRLASSSSIEENDGDGISIDITNSGQLKQYESNYRQALTDLTTLKTNIVDIENRLSEAMRELEIERALVKSEHDLVLKQILDASEGDQQRIQYLYNDLQLLIERIMAEKASIRNEIDYTQQTLFQLERELRQLEEQYRPSDDKILKKKETIAETRKKHEDLEFQLMELETRCEAELEQAEEHFQNQRILVERNTTVRQNTLDDLDRQQNVLLYQVIAEKEKLEQEKDKLKQLFKQKRLEVNHLEEKINKISSAKHENYDTNGHYQQQATKNNMWLNGNTAAYHANPPNLYSSGNYTSRIVSPKTNMKSKEQEKINEIKEMIAVAQLEKMTALEQELRQRYNELLQSNDNQVKRVQLEQKSINELPTRDYSVQSHVKLRDKNRMQERPLTRYLPIRSLDFDLRAHIEGAGHLLDSPHIHITSTSCRGFLLKMGGMKFKTWNRRWFVFDRKRRSLFYYQDKTETKLRGCIYFQSILEVYVDHLQSISLRSPEPREATFIVKTIERPYYLVAPTVESMRMWVDVIITGAEGNTFAGES